MFQQFTVDKAEPTNAERRANRRLPSPHLLKTQRKKRQ